MFALRPVVILSVCSVVLGGTSFKAIAQVAPLNQTREDSADGQVLLSSLGSLAPHLEAHPTTALTTPVAIAPEFLQNVGSLATPKANHLSPPAPQTPPELLANAGVLTAPQPATVVPATVSVTPASPSPHLGAIAAPMPPTLLANAQARPTAQPSDTAQSQLFTPLVPEGANLAANVESIPDDLQPEQLPDVASSDVPVVKPLPPEQVVNTELQGLIDPLQNPAVTVPAASAEVTADQEMQLTLTETIRLALERNETLKEAQLTLERTQYQLREAIADNYPTLTQQIDITRSETASGELAVEAAGGDESNPDSAINSRLEMSYDIYAGGRRAAQHHAAATQLKINELEVERVTEEIRLRAARTYYDLQSADAQTVIENSAVHEANRSLKDAELLEQAGLGTKFDVLRAQVDLANAQQRLTRAEAVQKIARRQLAQLLSLDSQAEPYTADEIAIAGKWEMPLADTIVLALQQRHELRQQLLLREIDGYQQRIALANIRPQVSIFANYDVLDVFKDNLDMADGITLGARMRWNIFDGGAAAARADQEQVDKAIAENRFINQRNQIRLAVEDAYYNLQASEANIKTASVAVTLAEESLRLARLRFKAGVGTQTDVISAQTELNTARGNYLQAVTDYNRAFVQLKREVGLGDAVISD